MKLKELIEARKKKLNDAKAICEKAIAEERDLTAEEKSQTEALIKESKDILADIQKKRADADLLNEILELGKGLDLEDSGSNGNGHKGQRHPAGKSLGDLYTASPEYLDWLKKMAPGGGSIPESTKVSGAPVMQFKCFPGLFRQKDLITGASDTSAGAFVTPDYTGIYEPLGRWPLNLRDLISVRQTGSDTVEYVRQTTQVTQAAPTAESNVTTFSGASGEVSGLKPEAAMAFERVAETVKTIAVWQPATNRALSDAAQLRGLIDQDLRDDLAEELEDQLLNGDGIGENFTGLTNTSGVLVQAYDTSIPDTIRKAMTNLKVNGKQMPTGILMNPSDWETVDLLKDNEGRYLWGGPVIPGRPQMWGVPVVESMLLTEGTAWVGNWRKMVLWDREQTTVRIGEPNDFFLRNMIAILAEMRAAMGVVRPSAFVEVDLSSGS